MPGSFRTLVATLGLCIAANLGIAANPAFAGVDRCAAPDDLAGVTSALPHVAAVLKPGATFKVLTVGSATVFNPVETLQPGSVTALSLGVGGAAKPAGETPVVSDAAFPLQMARMLRLAYPGLTVEMTVKGGRGITASDMLEIIRTELAANHYQMVIWQTGTVEAVRNVPAGTFYQTLADGAALIGDAGADLVLVDPQYSRFLHANTDLDPYEQALQGIAAQPGVILFHRFDLMHFWSNEGQIDLERTARSQRQTVVEALHACLGQALARMVVAASKEQS